MAGGYLLDTHIWIWYLVGSQRLPEGLRKLIERGDEELFLSPISVWEVTLLAQSGKLQLKSDVEGWVEEALERFPLREAVLNHRIALASREVGLPHRDPADRFLAATARIYDLRLMTVDRRLVKAPEVATVDH